MFLESTSASGAQWLPYTTYLLLPLALIYNVAGTIDLLLLLSFTLIRNWKPFTVILQAYDFRPLFVITRGVLGAFGLSQAAKLLVWKRRPATKEEPGDKDPKPLLFPARTTHTRLFPKTHSFSFSYLLVGIPVAWQGSTGGMLAADQGSHGHQKSQKSSSGSSWYTVHASDYLDRGNGHLGLNGKLRDYLQSQVRTALVGF
jgi:hypothetical protein